VETGKCCTVGLAPGSHWAGGEESQLMTLDQTHGTYSLTLWSSSRR
jgi:hypothetical protein